MAFSVTGLELISSGPRTRTYAYETTDTLAAVLGAGYFDAIRNQFRPNDRIQVEHRDGVTDLLVTSLGASVGLAQLDSGLPPLNALSHGVKGDGVTDDTAAIAALLARGGDQYFPAGDYFISAAGANTGGIEVSLSKSLSVTCDTNARFFTDDLDNDLIRFVMPNGGTGLPADGIELRWRGGTFDQTAQRGSTSMPDSVAYPPVKQGTSATCDGLSIRGAYTAGTVKSGIRLAEVRGVTFKGGAHWQAAGGDTGLYVEGVKALVCVENSFLGSRDCGVYTSADGTGAVGTNYAVERNRFVNCYHGVAVKRGVIGFSVSGNTFEGCIRGVTVEMLVLENRGGRVVGNAGVGTHVLVRLERAMQTVVEANVSINAGAFLADGATTYPNLEPQLVRLEGCTECLVAYNTSPSINAAMAAAYAGTRSGIVITTSTTSGTVQSTDCTILRNRVTGWRVMGTSNGTRCALIENFNASAETSANFTSIGSNSPEVRYSGTNARPEWQTTMGFADGTAAAPMLARYNQSGVGVFFGSNLVGLAANSVSQLEVNANGVSLPSYQAFASDAAAATGSIPLKGVYFNTTVGALVVRRT